MANELKVKNGLIVQGQITANGITASLHLGTSSLATTASNAITSSYSLTATSAGTATSASYAGTASVLLGSVVSASYALSASFSLTATSATTATSASYASTSSVAVTAISATSATSANSATIATSASFASSSISSSFSITSSALIGWNFNNTGSILQSINTQSVVISLITGSYIAAFFDYAAVSASNIRAGTIFGSWINGSISYTEVSNVDVGDTSQVTMSLGISASSVQLSSSISNTTPWTIKALGRYI